MIVLPVLVAAQASQCVIEFVHRPIGLDCLMTPKTEHFDVRPTDDRGCFARVGITAATGLSQFQQRQRDDRQKGNGRLKPILARELKGLGPAAGLHAFVILLNDPATFIPTNHSISRFETSNRLIGNQYPFQTFLTA